MTLHIILYEPEIPQNTGNIMRHCANTGHNLHLIEPLGFILSDKHLRRSGMDYIKDVSYNTYGSLDECISINNFDCDRIFMLTTKAKRAYSDVEFRDGDIFMFGPETRGLPDGVLANSTSKNKLIIPMIDSGRSLNLSNSVSIVMYEAWRQLNFSVI